MASTAADWFDPDVASGVHRITHAETNCYLVEDPDTTRLTLIDAGLPRTWRRLVAALLTLRRRPSDIGDVVLTHGHFDHLGMAARLAGEYGATVWVHPADVPITRHPFRYRPSRVRGRYPLRHPRSIPILAGLVAAGALGTRGVDRPRPVRPGQTLPVPGCPVITTTAGHTDGHCAVELAGRSVIFTGDALVTRDPYTGRSGPRVVARAGTADPDAAFAALATIEASGAGIVLPGHGAPWRGGAAAAAAIARARFPLP